MRISVIARFIGIIILINALFLFISASISLYLAENSFIPLLYTALITALIGVFPLIFVPNPKELSIYEGIIVVAGGWITTCLIGSMPYFMWGGEFSFVNAFFESVSGYTTTGATILKNIEALPNGMLFWRASTHFIGGLGVVLFALVIIPMAAESKLLLFNFEVSNLSKNNFQYRARYALKVILFVYILLIVASTLLYYLGTMSFFQSICHAFSVVATGGFSTMNDSKAEFDCLYSEMVSIFFMFVSAIHFGLIFETLRLSKFNIFKSTVVRYYTFVTLIAIVLIAFKLYLNGDYNLADSFRYSSFQTVSIMTTTGFATADTSVWPVFTHIILIFLMIHCGCAGSTTSGLKADRILIMLKAVRQHIRKLQHPNAVILVKVNKVVVPWEVVNRIGIYIFIYSFLLFLSTFILSFFDLDIVTAFSASLATLSNIGPGLGEVGSLSNYSAIPDGLKIVLSINMLIGRLEIFGFISIFFIRTWR